MLMKIPANVAVNVISSPAGGADIEILLALAAKVKDLPGNFAEFGVYRGQTLLTLALHIQQTGQRRIFHGFDSFEGFDDSVDIDLALAGKTDSQLKKGGFNDTSLESVMHRVNALRLNNVVRLHKGYFETTLPAYPSEVYALAHVDCDIYQSYLTCMNYVYPKMVKGGVILLDEYNDPHWPGCNKAIDEFMADKPEKLIMIERNNHQKYYIQKI
jgi:O-methyltransferase